MTPEEKISFLIKQLKILRAATPWPGIEQEIQAKEAELRAAVLAL